MNQNHPNRARKGPAAVASAVSTATIEKPGRKRRVAPPAVNHDAEYNKLLLCIELSRVETFEAGDKHFFTTDAVGLWEIYLRNLPPTIRQHYNCHACRRFIETYGGLVAIKTKGGQIAAMWRDGKDWPPLFIPAVNEMRRAVERAKVTGPFLSPLRVWGVPKVGFDHRTGRAWTHFSASVGTMNAFKPGLHTAEQVMASKREDFKNVRDYLGNVRTSTLAEALRLFETGSLNRPEKFVEPMRWLHGLSQRLNDVMGTRTRNNLIWWSVASAPAGYCHPNAAVTNELVKDIQDRRPIHEIKRRFAAKTAAEDYQRPKAPPAAGNIITGERIVEKLGLGRSLPRRFARLEDIETVWTPPPLRRRDDRADAMAYGVFSHLKTKDVPSHGVEIPPVVMTWVKFSSTVLPSADRIQLHVPAYGPFIALITAVHADAPPIMAWDREDRRNPVGWYVWPRGSEASQWGLRPGWCNVPAVALLPNLWGPNPLPHHSEGAVFILEGAKDSANGGGALFPEHMRGELHEIRSTVEAYSRAAQLYDRDKATACGYDFRKITPSREVLLKILSNGRWTSYLIDRWD